MTLANGLNAITEGVQYQSTVGAWSGLTGGAVGSTLTSNGAGILPSFQPTATGLGIGKWVLLAAIDLPLSVSSNVTFSSLMNSSIYQDYVIMLGDVAADTGQPTLLMRGSVNNGSTWISTAYMGGSITNTFNSATLTNRITNTDFLNLPQNGDSDTVFRGITGQVWINLAIEPALGIRATTVNSELAIVGDVIGTSFKTFSTSSYSPISDGQVNALQFTWSNGAGLVGNFTMYGLLRTGGSGSGGGLTWFEVTTTSASMTVNNGYVASNAALVTLTLPASAAVGDQLTINGKGAGGWRIAQNALQQVQLGTLATTAGVGGFVASINRYDSVVLQCITAGTATIWTAKSAGNLDLA